jgi:hypothetical protein
MRVLMGVVRDRHGTYYARVKVPDGLQEAVAQVLENGKARQAWLKRSLRTKNLQQANIIAKPVLMEFDRILARAKALLAEKPLRSSLSQSEIDRIAEYHLASTLAFDDEERREGTAWDSLYLDVARQLTEAGVEFAASFPLDAPKPEYGLSGKGDRQTDSGR